MKKLLFILVILTSGYANADCSSSGLSFYPTTYTVSENSLFFIEGYALDRDLVRSIGKEYVVKLVSKKETIELEKINLFESMMSLTIVSLKPKKNLSQDVSYEIKIYDKNGKEFLAPTRYDGNACDWLPVMYKATKEADNTRPKWTEKPKFQQSSFTAFGCGPAMYANFNCKVEDESEIFVMVKLKNLESEKINQYPVLLRGGIIQIGHGMCSGEFTFERDTEYATCFRLFDLSGNNLNEWTDWFKFKNPQEEGFK